MVYRFIDLGIDNRRREKLANVPRSIFWVLAKNDENHSIKECESS